MENPKSWNDIDVETYQELIELTNKDLGKFEALIEKYAIIKGIMSDDPIFEDLDIDELVDELGKMQWIFSQPTNNYKREINGLKCKSTNKFTLGEFIDLEYYFSQDYIKNLHYISAIFYRKSKLDEWDNEVEEPYIYDIHKRAEGFLDVSINDVYGLIKLYIDFKEVFMTSYALLFEDDGWDKIETEGLDEQEIRELQEEIEQDKKVAKWNWPRLIHSLSNDDVTKFNKIVDMPLIFIFNHLGMKKELKL